MTVPCQRCGAENDDQARFCDQCGSPLTLALDEVAVADPTPPPPLPMPSTLASAPRRSNSVNWIGLLLTAAVLCGLGFIVFAQPKPPATQTPGQVFGQVQKDLEKLKGRLA